MKHHYERTLADWLGEIVKLFSVLICSVHGTDPLPDDDGVFCVWFSAHLFRTHSGQWKGSQCSLHALARVKGPCCSQGIFMYHQYQYFWYSNTVTMLFPLFTAPGPMVIFGYCFVFHTMCNIVLFVCNATLCMFIHIGMALESQYTLSAVWFLIF